MRSIDVTMLQYLKPFFYVAETGSIRRAAEQLFLAPSAVSHQICQLEKLLGYPLFERRGGRSLRLLPAGRVLYERIPMLDNELFLLRSEMRNCQTEPEKISIGVFTQYRKILLSCLSGYSRATGRLDRVCLTESSDGDQLCRALYAGMIDYAVMFEENLQEGILGSAVRFALRLRRP